MKLHYSLLTVAIACASSNIFAMDATESNQAEQTILEQSIDPSKPIHGFVGVMNWEAYSTKLNNGKRIYCSNANGINCTSRIDPFPEESKESSQFFDILKKRYKKSQTLEKSIDISEPIEGSLTEAGHKRFSAALINGRNIHCTDENFECKSWDEDDRADLKESPLFYAILEKMYKKQRSDLEEMHKKNAELLEKSVKCNCPQDGSFTPLQRKMHRKWVNECKDLDAQIKKSKETLDHFDKNGRYKK